MNWKLLRRVALGVGMVLLLAACNLPINPTQTPEPTPTSVPPLELGSASTGAACLVGTWQIDDLNQYMQAVLPQMIEGAQAQIKDVSGVLTYSFNADGTTIGLAQDFMVTADVTTSGFTVPGEITLNGATSGQYLVDESQTLVTLSSVAPGSLVVSASVSGIPVVQDAPMNDLLSFNSGQSASGSTTFLCDGNTLTLAIDVPNTGIQSLVLTRVQP